VASRLVGLALGILLLLLPPAGQAQEVSIEPRGGVPLEELPAQAAVEEFEIAGADAFSGSQIKRRLHTEAKSGLPFFRKTKRLNKEEFLKDLRRVVVFYQQNGYFDADVEGYRAEREADGKGVRLAIFVREGEPSSIDTLRLEVAEGEELRELTLEDLRQTLSLREGDVFSEARIDSAQATLTATLQNRGYAFAEVLKEYRIDKEARRATLIFTAYPGGLYRFGRVRIEGDTDISEKLIRGQVLFEPGQLYELDRVYGTQRKLYQLNLFRRVEVEPEYEAPVGDSLPVTIRVTRAKEHLVRLGAGYGSEELVRGSASWLDRNFLGGARQARVLLEGSKLRRLASASLTQPNVLFPDLSATGTMFYSQDREEGYHVRRTGGSGRINHEVSPSVRTFYGFNLEHDRFTEIDSVEVVRALLGEQFLNPSTLAYLEVGALLDTTDDIFSPTEGFTVNLNYHLANKWALGDYEYHRVTLLATHYREIARGWVVALKVLPGIIDPFGASAADTVVAVPLFERLFAGGSTSVRGYQRRRLGPLSGSPDDPDEERDPVGGEALLEGSAELRFPLFGNFRGVVFLDAGNVYPEPAEISLSELRYTPGVGLRYATPIGPVRIDAGFKTKSEDPGPRVVFHFSIGNAF
jgi:outer membrane protein assembly complex protein YaeT